MWANFKALWDKILLKYPDIHDLPNDCNYAFELYGFMCPIIAEYKVDLDCALLYTMKGKDIFPPPNLEGFNIPLPICYHIGTVSERTYKDYEEIVEKNYVEKKSMEGVMFYVTESDGWHAYKCKSLSLLRDTQDSISYNEIRTTCINAVEITENLDDLYKNTLNFLLESYKEPYLTIFDELIKRVVHDIRRHIEFENEVMRVYKSLNLNFKADKPNCMRTIMKHFDRRDSAVVYNALTKRA